VANIPDTYYVSIGLIVVFAAFGLSSIRTNWAVPYLAVLGTIAGWYLIEPIYFSDSFSQLNADDVRGAFDAVSICLIVFAFSAPILANKLCQRKGVTGLNLVTVPASRILIPMVGLWVLLLLYGIYRMDGNVLGALFPLQARSGGSMWSRSPGGGAGAIGFIVSTASYLYVLTLASFGVLFFFLPRGRYRTLALILIVVSWPYAFLQGARNVTLAVVLPALICYLLRSRKTLFTKAVVTLAALFVLDIVFRIIILYRNIGFYDVQLSHAEAMQHLGLNMASELVHCVRFINDGILEPGYGLRYLSELANVIPRAIWPSKPLLGVDYAIARGFGSQGSDIGVFVTVSSGVIGQGVLDFGPLLGPAIAALLLATWVAILARFHSEDTPLRYGLYLIGLGLTFNLGRDITLLVLWPMVFGYAGVRFLEHRNRQSLRSRSGRQLRTLEKHPRYLTSGPET
jgi:oligosaccharide repeat unit polymerase